MNMLVCPQCGQENPEGFKFCGNCAAPLAAAPPVEAEERKLVSVLFVDLVGHTAASDQAVLAELEGRLDEAHELQLGLARRWEEYGSVYEAAHAHLGRARCLVALSRNGEAAEDLQEARAIFSRLEAVPLLTEADGLLSQAATG